MPQTALIVDQQGTYVFRGGGWQSGGQRVKLGGELGPYAIVDDGLKGGEQVIVQGMESLRPGAAVWPARRRRRSAEAEAMFSAIFIDRPRLATVIAIVTDDRRPAVAAGDPDRAVSRHRAAAGVGHHDLSGRFGRGRGGDRRAADRKPGRRRRQDDLHEERQRQRRQLLTEGLVRARHRSRHQHRQCQQPRAGRAVQAARGCAASRASR